MTEYAHIVCHYNELQPFGHYYTYEWLGKRSQPVIIGREVFQSKDFVDFPWKLVLIEERIDTGQYIMLRKDALFPLGFLIIARLKIHKAWLWFKYRLIITANVWGLAHTRPGDVPSWRDFRKDKK